VHWLDFATFHSSNESAAKLISTKNTDKFFLSRTIQGKPKVLKQTLIWQTKIAVTARFKYALHEYGKMGKYKRIFMTVNDLNNALRDGLRVASYFSGKTWFPDPYISLQSLSSVMAVRLTILQWYDCHPLLIFLARDVWTDVSKMQEFFILIPNGRFADSRLYSHSNPAPIIHNDSIRRSRILCFSIRDDSIPNSLKSPPEPSFRPFTKLLVNTLNATLIGPLQLISPSFAFGTSVIQIYSIEDDYIVDTVSTDSKNIVASHANGLLSIFFKKIYSTTFRKMRFAWSLLGWSGRQERLDHHVINSKS
jgi:hypothetical protein